MNEKRIQEVIEIEKQADVVYKKAVSESEQLPVKADQKGKALIEKAHQEAEAEAQKILASAEAKEECDRILTQAEEEIKHNQILAKRNFDRAVSYVISRILSQG